MHRSPQNAHKHSYLRRSIVPSVAAVNHTPQKPALRNFDDRRMYVTHIEKHLRKESIEKEFAEVFEGLVEVIMATGKADLPESCNPGFCFLEFEDESAARKAMEQLKKHPGMMVGRLDGIEVNWCGQCVEVAKKCTCHSAEIPLRESKEDVTELKQLRNDVDQLRSEVRAGEEVQLKLVRRQEKVEESLRKLETLLANAQHKELQANADQDNENENKNKENVQEESAYLEYERRPCGQTRQHDVEYLRPPQRASSRVAARRFARQRDEEAKKPGGKK